MLRSNKRDDMCRNVTGKGLDKELAGVLGSEKWFLLKMIQVSFTEKVNTELV